MGEMRLVIPDPLHKTLKKIAVDQDISLTQLVIDILKNSVNNDTEKDEHKIKKPDNSP